MQTTLERRFDIVLKPISHTELGEVRIDSDLFAVGRAETPFASARAEIVSALSRRHAKLFFEHGAAYVADLGSKNGTTVNGAEVRQRPHALHDGDEVRFAGVLAYRVGFVARAEQPKAQQVVVTLRPERDDLGLQPVVISGFPFLVSKTGDTFARYHEAYPHQVNYVSRRHAHIFLRGGDVFVEDLGSTNGTFVGGKRLEESAVRLEDGALLAFGGNHFVYRVELHRGGAADSTVTQTKPADAAAQPAADETARRAPAADVADATQPAPAPPQPAADPEHTTFVGSAHSFLDIFCVDPAVRQDDEVNPEASQAEPRRQDAPSRSRGNRFTTFVSELSQAFGGSGEPDMRRIGRWAGAALAALCVLAVVLYVRGAPQREMKTLMADGDYGAAAVAADRYLAAHPGDAVFQAAGTEALMKSNVPPWLAALRARAFDRARSVVVGMQALAQHNARAQPLVAELAWMGDLEAFWAARGGADAPVRLFRDEAVIRSLIDRWNDDPDEHQHVLDQIVSYVPEFSAPYADALSHLRKLQSDDSVYVAAADRLTAAIVAALNDDRLDALPAMLDDYHERYPRLAGLDLVRDDLKRYEQIESDARAGNTQAAADELKAARFATPPFQARLPELGRLAADSKGGGSAERPSP